MIWLATSGLPSAFSCSRLMLDKSTTHLVGTSDPGVAGREPKEESGAQEATSSCCSSFSWSTAPFRPHFGNLLGLG